MFPCYFPIDPWTLYHTLFNSTLHIGIPDYHCERKKAMWLSTKTETEDLGHRLDVTNFTTLIFLGIICLSSLGKESKCLKIKSCFLNIFSTIKVCKKKFILAFIPYMIQIMTGLFLHAIFLPFVVPVFLLFWFISQVVKILVWLQYGRTATKCSGMDSVWGLETPLSRPIITGMFTMSGKPDIEKIRNHIKSKIVDAMDPSGNYQYRKFRQLFFRHYGYYIWQDDVEFNILNHVTMVYLKPSVCDKKFQVLKYVNKTENMTLASHQPPWHIKVLNTGDERYSLLIILHHAIGDGISMVRLCMENLVDTPMPLMYPSPPKPHPILQVMGQVWSAMVLPLGMIKIIANNDKSSLHGTKLSGEKVVVSSNGVPLELVRCVKKAAGATVNDVLMSCLASATTKLMARRKETCAKITTVIPVSFHQNNDILKLRNCFSCGIVKLSTKPTTSSLARLRNTKNVFDKLKMDPTLAATYWTITAVSDIIPAPIAERLFTGKGITLAASNVPGPQQKLFMWGDAVEDIGFWVPNRAPTGVGFSIISYRGVIKASLIVDTALIESEKEAQQFLDDFEWEVYQLNKELTNTKERYAHWSRFKTLHTVVKTFSNIRIDADELLYM